MLRASGSSGIYAGSGAIGCIATVTLVAVASSVAPSAGHSAAIAQHAAQAFTSVTIVVAQSKARAAAEQVSRTLPTESELLTSEISHSTLYMAGSTTPGPGSAEHSVIVGGVLPTHAFVASSAGVCNNSAGTVVEPASAGTPWLQ